MQKKGISLIVLVITIIVMIILAATVVISLTSNGIIDRANDAVDASDKKQVEHLAALAWAEAYTAGIRDQFMLEMEVKEALRQQGVNVNDYDITVDNTGVNMNKDTLQKNEYNFYFDKEYVCERYDHGTDLVYARVKFTENGGMQIIGSVIEYIHREGMSVSAVDFMGEEYIRVPELKYNTLYTGTGSMGAQCSFYVNSEGVYIEQTTIPGSVITYSDKKTDIANGGLVVTFSEDGKSFVFNGQTFKIAE